MKYKEIAKAIKLCGSTPEIYQCESECPYYCGSDMSKCIPKLTSDAADAIFDLCDKVDCLED